MSWACCAEGHKVMVTDGLRARLDLVEEFQGVSWPRSDFDVAEVQPAPRKKVKVGSESLRISCAWRGPTTQG